MHEEYMAYDTFIEGNVRVKLFRQLPEGATNLKFIKKDTLTKATRKNLDQIAEKYDIHWQECLEYSIVVRESIRHGRIIKGRTKHNDPIEYWRLETSSPVAGQSYVYYGYRKRIRSHVLRNGVPGGRINTNVELKHQQEWLKFLKRLEFKKSVEKIERLTANIGTHSKINEIIETLNTLVRLENERSV